MTDWAIRVKDLRKQYAGRDGPVDAVNGLDLEVPVGECFGLLGPNGAGKTTTVEILEGLNEPTAGEVEVLGLRWEDHEAAIRERIGVTLQETRFPDKQTVAEMVRLFRSFYRAGLEPREVLARVALESKANSYVEQLSGGQQQRLAVALALVGDPELLFLDEPTTGLDPQSRGQLWEVIRGLHARGRTIVITTHYMDEAERLCDRVAIIDQGRVIALGPPADLIARIGGEHIVEFALGGDRTPPDPATFLGLATVLAARADGDAFALTVGEPHHAIPALLDHLEAEGRPLVRLTTRQASLEDVFVQLTGRHLRDDEPQEPAAGRSRPGRRWGRKRRGEG
jgi:ABC-2 type transport system ATP-binding protein